MRLLAIRRYHGRGCPAGKEIEPTAADIERSITNICRCGTYARIKAAITAVAAAERNTGPTDRGDHGVTRRTAQAGLASPAELQPPVGSFLPAP